MTAKEASESQGNRVQYSPALAVFVSYEHSDALAFATEARSVFRDAGYDAWVWEYDRSLLGYVAEGIDEQIRRCDWFLYIATKGSDGSRGQRDERNRAVYLHKEIVVLAFDRKYVSSILESRVYNLVSPETFSDVCHRLAGELRHQQRLLRGAEYRGEAEPLESA